MASCDDEAGSGTQTYLCGRKKGHKGKHRERWYGVDREGPFRIVVKWKRDAR